jgi:hypothetical protein
MTPRRRVEVDFSEDEGQVHGVVIDGDSREREFSGWLELLAALRDSLLRAPS